MSAVINMLYTFFSNCSPSLAIAEYLLILARSLNTSLDNLRSLMNYCIGHVM